MHTGTAVMLNEVRCFSKLTFSKRGQDCSIFNFQRFRSSTFHQNHDARDLASARPLPSQETGEAVVTRTLRTDCRLPDLLGGGEGEMMFRYQFHLSTRCARGGGARTRIAGVRPAYAGVSL